MSQRLLIIDDNPDFIDDISLLLEDQYSLLSATDPRDGLKQVELESPDIVLLDLMFEGESMNGLDILKRIRALDDSLPVIMVTDYGSIDTAVEAIRLGATDYISKTPHLNELELIIERALRDRARQLHSRTLQEESRKPYHVIIGRSAPIQHLLEMIDLMAGNTNPVLITGESGTGKELVARQIHARSDRRNQPFVALNCAAIPKDLLESELFGYEKGAFTGATKRKPGKFEIASRGVIFFDEISELSPEAQVKLLRVLQEQTFERVGGNSTVTTDARILAATNSELQTMVNEGTFREDLFYRLDVLRIHVPPLRERREDIPLLADHFLSLACADLKTSPKTIADSALDQLKAYDWPGNVRELRNFLTRAAILTPGDTVTMTPDQSGLQRTAKPVQPRAVPTTREELEDYRQEAVDRARREVEYRFVKYCLDKFDGNVTKAARYARINRTNFHKMMKRCGFQTGETKA